MWSVVTLWCQLEKCELCKSLSRGSAWSKVLSFLLAVPFSCQEGLGWWTTSCTAHRFSHSRSVSATLRCSVCVNISALTHSKKTMASLMKLSEWDLWSAVTALINKASLGSTCAATEPGVSHFCVLPSGSRRVFYCFFYVGQGCQFMRSCSSVWLWDSMSSVPASLKEPRFSRQQTHTRSHTHQTHLRLCPRSGPVSINSSLPRPLSVLMYHCCWWSSVSSPAGSPTTVFYSCNN